MFDPEPIAATDAVELILTPKRVRARVANLMCVTDEKMDEFEIELR